ncbi:hypothetical protein [Alicyclobacillus macrosporangiidus]|nr:hypothetical protein [Alicyclobacillus macrosporangiidus]
MQFVRNFGTEYNEHERSSIEMTIFYPLGALLNLILVGGLIAGLFFLIRMAVKSALKSYFKNEHKK